MGIPTVQLIPTAELQAELIRRADMGAVGFPMPMELDNDLPTLEAELDRIISMRGETATSGRVLNVCADLAKAMKDMVRIFVKEEGK